jgi:hypothetical protein
MKPIRHTHLAQLSPHALWCAPCALLLAWMLLPMTAAPTRSAAGLPAAGAHTAAPQPRDPAPLKPAHPATASGAELRSQLPIPDRAWLPDAAAIQTTAAGPRFPHYGERLAWQDQKLEELDIDSLPPQAVQTLLRGALRVWVELELELLRAGTDHLGAPLDRRSAEEAYFSGACIYVLSPRAPSARRQYWLVSSDPDPRAIELRNLGISLLRSPGMQAHVKRVCLRGAEVSLGWPEEELQLRPASQGEGFEVYAPDGSLVAIHLLKLPGSP